MSEAFRYERDLSLYCKEKYVTKVSVAKDSGELRLAGYEPIADVPYLIFDLADGDIRDIISFNGKMDNILLFKSLHSIAVGLKQLHTIKIKHNDLKPSNVLVFGEEHKVGDLGSSTCSTISGPHDDEVFAGDWNYAPPEILYNYVLPDQDKRAVLIDLYLVGSMFAFYFTGFSMSTMLLKNLPEQFNLKTWTGNFDQVKDYLLEAFSLH